MTTVREQIVDVLSTDPDLSALLTGGVHTGQPLMRTMGDPNPFDASGAVKPCAYVRLSVSVAEGVNARFRRQSVNIFVYDSAGVDTIEAAVDRIKALLNDRMADGRGFYFRHLGNQDGVFDDILNAYLTVTQYEIVL